MKKQIVGGKELTTREASRMAQNLRRKHQRRLASIISAETGEKVSWKESMNVYKQMENTSKEMRELAGKIEGLYAQKQDGVKKGYAVDLETSERQLKMFTESRFIGKKYISNEQLPLQRKNKMFERQINLSTKKGGISELSGVETKAFYAATMDLWSNVSKSDSYNASIMRQFGIGDLTQVYNLLTKSELRKEDYGFTDENLFREWLDELNARINLDVRREIVQSEIRKIEGVKKAITTTDDEIFNQVDEKDTETSPEYVNRIISRVSAALNNV